MPPTKEAWITMPMFRELALAVPALVVCLLVSHAIFGSGDDEPARPSAAVSVAWIGADSLSAERLLAKDSLVTKGSSAVADRPPGEHRLQKDVTPHARIHGVFAQFVPGEAGRAI